MTSTTLPQTPVTRPPTRRPLYLLSALIAVSLIAAIAFMVMRSPTTHSPMRTDLDLALSKRTDQSLYHATIASRLDPIVINQLHAWTIHVATPDGQPIENAQIMVDGGMPDHGHGLPTQPRVTRHLGQGHYLIEGMRFNMPGWWVLKFQIAANNRTDTVTFNLVLQ